MKTQPKKCSSPRDLIVKTSLNADEFLPFRDKCAAAGVAVSARIRVLINRDVNPANRTNSQLRRERPKLGPVRALFPAQTGRLGGAPVPRLRL
jgi:hypothetical protein